MKAETVSLAGVGSLNLISEEVERKGVVFLNEIAADPDRAAELLEAGAVRARELGATLVKAGFRVGGDYTRPPIETPAGWTFAHDMELYRKDLTQGAATSETEARISLIPLRSENAADFMRIHDAAFATVPNSGCMTPEEVTRILGDPATAAGLLVHDGEPCGVYELATLERITDASRADAHLETIGLLSTFRGRGLGRSSLVAVERLAMERGARSLGLTVASSNRPAVGLYKAAGYERTRMFSRWYERPLGASGTDPSAALAMTPRGKGLSEQQAIVTGTMVTTRSLVDDLVRLGVKKGETLVVHASMSRMGWVCGGAETVVRALLEAIGPDGTLVMPAQAGANSDPKHWHHPPVQPAWWDRIRAETPPFDPQVTPTRGMGVVAELFRTWPGALRGSHPQSGFSALGPKAHFFAAEQPLAFDFGEGTPVASLYREDARVLLLGVGYDRCTAMHYAETRAGCRGREEQAAAVRDADGNRIWTVFPQNDVDSDDFPEAAAAFDHSPDVAHGKVGAADARLFRVRAGVDAVETFFRDHDVRRLSEADRGWLLEYLSAEPDVNLFLIGDIEGYGFDRTFQDLFAVERNGCVDSVLLRYNESYIVYSRFADFDPQPLLRTIGKYPERMLSGKREILERLRPFLPDLRFRDTHLSRLETVQDAGGPAVSDAVDRAVEADVEELVDLYCRIDEFETKHRRDGEIVAMRRTIAEDTGRYYLIRREGRIVSAAATVAENSASAMVVAVATDPAFRGQGLATRVVSELCRDVLSGGRAFLCLFYSNPVAGAIYRRIGFRETGLWTMASLGKEPVPAVVGEDKTKEIE
jgi:aminoglycoside 3-N-acetyltransferase